MRNRGRHDERGGCLWETDILERAAEILPRAVKSVRQLSYVMKRLFPPSP